MIDFTYGSLFSGIGGIDLGLDRAGMSCAWQVEIDEFCRKVLKKHWPDVTRYGDIRNVGKHKLAPVDLIAGGFPCQDISVAGKKAGIAGRRSGLWTEYFRVICELRPRFVLVENVSALLVRGFERVLGNLASLGYDAEWQVLRASDVGAPHQRARIFLVAYADSERCGSGSVFDRYNAIPHNRQWHAAQNIKHWTRWQRWISATFQNGDWSESASAFLGMAHGLSARVDRIRGLGNAVVPQVAEYVGRCTMNACADREVSA